MSQITLTVSAWIDEYTREDTMRQWLEAVARNGFPCELKTGHDRHQVLDVQIREVVPAVPEPVPWPARDPELAEAVAKWAMTKGAIITREWFGLPPAPGKDKEQESTP